jgi:tripartite ATP-independent transporter DctM subunit
MIEFVRNNMAPLMFVGLIVVMLFGYPAAFSVAAVGLLFGLIGVKLGLIEPDFLGNLVYQVFSIVSEEQGALLLAIPFFTFMGAILERSGLAEDLLESIGQIFGPVRGGLSYAVIFVGAILGAITGTVAASVIAMAVIALPLMLRYGYSVRHASGVIAASGTITQLIPPSLVLIVLAGQLGQSVGAMYAGAIGPSLIQIGLFCAWVLIVSLIWPNAVPALPPEARTLHGWALWAKCLRGIVPSLGLMFLVLGTIYFGLATPTEAGAMGAAGSLLLAAVNGRLTWTLTYQAMSTTMRITAMVVFILIGARVFSLVFQGVGGKIWIEDWLTSLPGGVIGFLIFVNIFIFVLAFFLDFFEIAFIVIPLLAPVAAKLGIDLVWFGLMICANIQTSFMHPPFGFALFYLRGVAPPTVRTADIYWGAVPWVVLQVILVAILIFWPQSVTYWIDRGPKIDPSTIKIELPMPDLPDLPPIQSDPPR